MRYLILIVIMILTTPTIAAPVASGDGSISTEQSGSAGATTDRSIERQKSLSADRQKRQSKAREQARSRSRTYRDEVPAASVIVPALRTVSHSRLADCAEKITESHQAWPADVSHGGGRWGGIDTEAIQKWAHDRTLCAIAVSSIARDLAADLGIIARDGITSYVDEAIRSLDIDRYFSNAESAMSDITVHTTSGGPPSWTMGIYRAGYGEDGQLALSRAGVRWYGDDRLDGANVTIAFSDEASRTARRSKERARSTTAQMQKQRNNADRSSASAEGRQSATTSARGGSQ